jgi:hypothetical protein
LLSIYHNYRDGTISDKRLTCPAHRPERNSIGPNFVIAKHIRLMKMEKCGNFGGESPAFLRPGFRAVSWKIPPTTIRMARHMRKCDVPSLDRARIVGWCVEEVPRFGVVAIAVSILQKNYQ